MNFTTTLGMEKKNKNKKKNQRSDTLLYLPVLRGVLSCLLGKGGWFEGVETFLPSLYVVAAQPTRKNGYSNNHGAWYIGIALHTCTERAHHMYVSRAACTDIRSDGRGGVCFSRYYKCLLLVCEQVLWSIK
jgi:hypothetical protein